MLFILYLPKNKFAVCNLIQTLLIFCFSSASHVHSLSKSLGIHSSVNQLLQCSIRFTFTALSHLLYIHEILSIMHMKKPKENWDLADWPGLIETMELNHS